MVRNGQNKILEPLLENTIHNERSFYDSYDNIRNTLEKEGEIYLSEPLGISINIVNITGEDDLKDLIDKLKNNRHFVQVMDNINENDKMDKNLFEEKTAYSFTRYKFKYIKKIVTGFKDIDHKDVNFSLFVSIAKTNLNYHIVSFIITTWNESRDLGDINESYVRLSNKQIISFIKKDSIEWEKIKKDVDLHEQKLGDLIKVDKNTFINLELWKDGWPSDEDAKRFVIENPYYFYSLIKRDEGISRRTYKIIMDILGKGFSTSIVQTVLFSANIYLEISMKPISERFNANGHDATLFRAMELFGLQNYLLTSIDISNSKYKVGTLLENMNKIYDFNMIFSKKTSKGELWIKFCTYLQDQIHITSSYNKCIGKYKIMLEKQEKPPNVFICYAREDLSAVIDLYNDLKNEGIEAWIDKFTIPGGKRWKKAIKKAIDESRYFLAVISTHSETKRGYLHKERAYAFELLGEFPEDAIYIIPIRLDECMPAHDILSELQWIDMFPDWESGVKGILKSMNEPSSITTQK